MPGFREILAIFISFPLKSEAVCVHWVYIRDLTAILLQFILVNEITFVQAIWFYFMFLRYFLIVIMDIQQMRLLVYYVNYADYKKKHCKFYN